MSAFRALVRAAIARGDRASAEIAAATGVSIEELTRLASEGPTRAELIEALLELADRGVPLPPGVSARNVAKLRAELYDHQYDHGNELGRTRANNGVPRRGPHSGL